MFSKKIFIPILLAVAILLGACFTARCLIVEPSLAQDRHEQEYGVRTSEDRLYLVSFYDDKNGNKVTEINSFMGGHLYNLEVSEVAPSYYGCPVRKLTLQTYSDCINLKKVVLPQTVEKIGAKTFSNCPNLKEVYIPATVSKIGKKVFYKSGNPTMYVEKGSFAEKYAKANKITYKYYTPKPDTEDTTDYSKLIKEATQKPYTYSTYYDNGKLQCVIEQCNPKAKDTDIVIPDEIKGNKIVGLAAESFETSDYIETVTIPDSVTYVGNYAFAVCANLKKVYFTENVKSIGFDIFGQSPNAVICAPENSYAHQYAIENKIKFESTD
jgi:hypothetical protein